MQCQRRARSASAMTQAQVKVTMTVWPVLRVPRKRVAVRNLQVLRQVSLCILRGGRCPLNQQNETRKGSTCAQFCTKSNIVSDEAFDRHWLHHTHDSGLKCCKCKKILSSKRTFKQHLLTHQTEKKYKCPHCDGAYSTKDACTAHVSEFHPEGVKGGT